MVRYKKRYLLVEISFEDGQVDETMSTKFILDSVRNAVHVAHGDYGKACVARSLKVKYVNPFTGVVFVACGREYHRMVWSSLTFIKSLNKRPCMCRVLHLGGTLRSCQKFLIRHSQDQLLKLLSQSKTPAERDKVTKAMKRASQQTLSLDPLELKKQKLRAKQARESSKIKKQRSETKKEIISDDDLSD